MALVALVSASGAPGVTTTALAMTLLWPRQALLVEADPAGGSRVIAGYLEGKVMHNQGLTHLGIGARSQPVADLMWAQTLLLDKPVDGSPRKRPSAVLDAGKGRGVLTAVRDSAQAPNLTPLWPELAPALTGLEQVGFDVVVDAGRAGAMYAPLPLLRAADMVLLVTGSLLSDVNAALARVSALREDLGRNPLIDTLGLLLIGQPREFSAQDIGETLGVPVVATIASDPVTAEVFSAGAEPGKLFDSSPLVTSTQKAITAVQERISARRRLLAPHSEPAADYRRDRSPS